MDDFETPQSRIEALLQNILGAENELLDPVSRNEKILHAILGEEIALEDPISRIEKLLHNWNGASYELEEPVSNNERILHNIIGNEVEIEPIQSRIEALLLMILERGSLPIEYKRLIGLTFNDNVYYKITGLKLRGSDTVRLSFSVTAACNVFGCYTTPDSDSNYSLYASTTANAKYLRYNGGTYLSAFTSQYQNVRLDVVITPMGSTGMPQDSMWEAKEFEASVDMDIGTSSDTASSAKLKGNLYGNFEVDGRFKGIPCERVSDGVLGYYDTYSKTFYEPIGGTPVSLGYDE